MGVAKKRSVLRRKIRDEQIPSRIPKGDLPGKTPGRQSRSAYSSMYVADWMPFSATVTLCIVTVAGRAGAICFQIYRAMFSEEGLETSNGGTSLIYA